LSSHSSEHHSVHPLYKCHHHLQNPFLLTKLKPNTHKAILPLPCIPWQPPFYFCS
jgi:hypothetical protein